MDFSAIDALSDGFGADGFREAALMYSNPNTFQEMYVEELAERAMATKAKKQEKKKAARDRKKSVKGEKMSDAKRVRKRQIDKDTGLEIDDPAEIAFKQIDKDGNGFLDLAELALAFGHLKHEEFNLSQEQVEAAMEQMDQDGDGKVTMAEFAVSTHTRAHTLTHAHARTHTHDAHTHARTHIGSSAHPLGSQQSACCHAPRVRANGAHVVRFRTLWRWK
jgi:hypothetical protein